MLRLLYKAPGADVIGEVPYEGLQACRAKGGWIWLDVLDAGRETIREVGALFGFDRVALEDVDEPTEFPKVDDYGDHVFLVMHGLDATDEARIATVEVDAFVGDDYLVTFRRAGVPAIEWLAEKATESPAFCEGGPDRMIARIAEAQARRFLPLIESLDARIDLLDEHAIAGNPAVVGEVQALRRDVIRLRRIVGPQREVMLSLSRPYSPRIGERARYRFGDVYDHLFRLVESMDSARGLLAAVLDTYRSAVAQRLNEVMKVLTVFSAILLPLSLLAGIYGMNVVNIPWSRDRWSFVAVVGVMGVVAAGLWVYFAVRGFIGGPTLRRLPKAVGLGLLHLAVIPVRTMTGMFTLGLPEHETGPEE